MATQADSKATTRIPALPEALPRGAKAKVEAAIEAHSNAMEALIAYLDVAGRDPDREASLAHDNSFDQRRAGANLILDNLHPDTWSASADYEEQCEGEGEQCEDEGAVEGL